MYLRLLIASAGCFLLGAGTLTVAVVCLAGAIAIGCELWLLGPLTMWPLSAGLGLLARAARTSRAAADPAPESTLDSDGTPSDQT